MASDVWAESGSPDPLGGRGPRGRLKRIVVSRSLAAARAKYGRPIVDLSYVAMRSNFAEIPAMVALCADLGASAVHVEPLLAQVGSPELAEHYANENLGAADAGAVAAAFETAGEIARNRGVRFSSRFVGEREVFDYVAAARQNPPTWACCEPWASIWITTEGEVRTCCLNDTTFGNLFEDDIDAIWNGEIFRRLREEQAEGRIGPGCANCFQNGRVRSSTFFRPTQPVTYYPYFTSVPPRCVDDPVFFDWPSDGATVQDELVIRGGIGDGVDPVAVDIVIDYTPIANLNDRGVFSGQLFTIRIPVPDLTEGAHVVWARVRGKEHGYAHRDVHFWRTENGAGALVHEGMNGR